MKKIYWFALSLGTAFLVFCAAAFLCLFLSTLDDEEKVNLQNEIVVDEKEPLSLKLLIIFTDSEPIPAAKLTVTPKNGTYTAETVSLESVFDRSAAETIDSEGTYPFIGRCLKQAGSGVDGFILLDSRNFIKIADRCDGMVYNDVTGSEVLLTGGQALSLLDSHNFTNFCAQAAEYALNGGMYTLFSYLADNTINNLSYPALYLSLH